jgi:serine/threonine-protein kinase
VHNDRNEYAGAIADWGVALNLDPDHAWTASQLAWLLATCPDGRQRDGPRAVRFARRACEAREWKDAASLATLAAAHAECGEFPDAVRRQEEAVNRASGPQKEFYAYLLRLYRSGEPYRQER